MISQWSSSSVVSVIQPSRSVVSHWSSSVAQRSHMNDFTVIQQQRGLTLTSSSVVLQLSRSSVVSQWSAPAWSHSYIAATWSYSDQLGAFLTVTWSGTVSQLHTVCSHCNISMQSTDIWLQKYITDYPSPPPRTAYLKLSAAATAVHFSTWRRVHDQPWPPAPEAGPHIPRDRNYLFQTACTCKIWVTYLYVLYGTVCRFCFWTLTLCTE